MKKTLRQYYLLPLAIFLLSCQKNNRLPDCSPPPPSMRFRLMDAQTNKDLLATGALTNAQVTAVNSAGKSLYVYYTDGDTVRIVSVLGFERGKHNYTLKVGTNQVAFSAELLDSKCGLVAGEMKVLDADVQRDKSGNWVVKF